jgi:hypothetical protein
MTNSLSNMFESIKKSVNESKNKKAGSSEYLKMEIDGTYNLRFLINQENPKDTFYHYYFHGWNSVETGQYVQAYCPTTVGERCPICEARFKLFRTKKDEDKELASLLKRKEQHLANVYIIDSSSREEDTDSVKIFRMAKTIYEKVVDAIDGDDADEYGPKIFDLTENGCTFRIKVTSQQIGDKKIPCYEKATFRSASAIPNMNKEKIEKIYSEVHDLSKCVSPISTDEMMDLMTIHVFAGNKGVLTTKNINKKIEESVPTTPPAKELTPEEMDELPFDDAPSEGAPVSQKKDSSDNSLDELMQSLSELED